MHPTKCEMFGASAVEDSLARDNSLLGVCIKTGAELGVLQLQGNSMHDVAGNEYVVKSIDCMARGVSRGGNSSDGAKQSISRLEELDTSIVGWSYL